MSHASLNPLGYMGVTNGGHWQAVTAASGHPVDATDLANARARAEAYAASSRADAIHQGAVEDAGIRAGEIVGNRAWWVGMGDGLLRSMVAQHVVWHPGKPIDASGDFYGFYGGVHSFKSHARAVLEFASGYAPVVFGTVWHWGDVIEHEHGYRSQYAAIRTLEVITTPLRRELWPDQYPTHDQYPTLDALRELYKDDLSASRDRTSPKERD